MKNLLGGNSLESSSITIHVDVLGFSGTRKTIWEALD